MRKNNNDEFDPERLPEFKIPTKFLKQLESFSYDGDYLLFVRNSRGEVVPITHTSSSCAMNGMLSYLASFALSHLQNNSESIADKIFNPDDYWSEED